MQNTSLLDKQNQAEAKKDWCPHGNCHPLGWRQKPLPLLAAGLCSRGEDEKETEPVKRNERGDIEEGGGCFKGGNERKKDEREDRSAMERQRRETKGNKGPGSRCQGGQQCQQLFSSKPSAGAWREHPSSALPLQPHPPSSPSLLQGSPSTWSTSTPAHPWAPASSLLVLGGSV